jgi:hypothetical protein
MVKVDIGLTSELIVGTTALGMVLEERSYLLWEG